MRRYKAFIMFLSGAITGVTGGIIAAWKFLKQKADKEVDDTRQSLYELMKKEVDEKVEQVFQESEENPEADVNKYRDLAEDYSPDQGYVRSFSRSSAVSDIYTITPDDYYYDREHDKEELVYYEEEDVLADGNDDEVSIDETVTYECLKCIGEYEQDAVYVRNDIVGTDYCVTITSEHYVSPGVIVEDDYE